MSNSNTRKNSILQVPQEALITKEYKYETRIRQFTQEIIDPAMKKVEECTRNVDYFSQLLDESNKKFDDCYDVYEVLNDKSKIRFKDLDGLLIKVQRLDNDQIITQGANKQELKEIRQEIVELKEKIADKTEKISILFGMNEKLQNELVISNKRIYEMKDDLQAKLSLFADQHFQAFLDSQKEFIKIKEDFMLTQKTVEYHKEVFDSLQSTLGLYKMERVEVKNRIEELQASVLLKLPRNEFEEFDENIRRQLSNQVEREENARRKINDKTEQQYEENKKRIDSCFQESLETNNQLAKLREKVIADFNQTNENIWETKKDISDSMRSIKDITSQIELLQQGSSQQAISIGEIRLNVRKEFLKIDQEIQQIIKNTPEQIKKFILKESSILRGDITKQITELISQSEEQQKEEFRLITLQFCKPKSDVSSDQKDENIQQDLSSLWNGPKSQQKTEELVNKLLKDYALQSKVDETICKQSKAINENMAHQIKAASQDILKDVIQQLKSSMVTQEEVNKIQQNMNSIINLKNDVASTFERIKQEHSLMGDKVERVTFKLTTLQSDSSIDSEFFTAQLKKQSQEKDALKKSIKALCLLTATLSEAVQIQTAMNINQELQRKAEIDIFDNPINQQIPSRFYSQSEGLVFEVSNEIQTMHPCRLNYRQQVVEKYDLLRSSMAAIVGSWEYIGGQKLEEFTDNTPGFIFKATIISKTKTESQTARIHGSMKRMNNKDNEFFYQQSNTGGGNLQSFYGTSNELSANDFEKKLDDIATGPQQRKKRASLSMNHRKLLRQAKELSNSSLVPLHKMVTTPTSIKKQQNKLQTSGELPKMNYFNN